MPEDKENQTPAKAEANTEAPKLEEVRLKKPHRHRDADHEPGAKIKVTPAQKKRLQDREII